MNLPTSTHQKADAISTGMLLIALGILMYTGAWWPGILLGIGASLMTRQYFLGKYYDILLSALIFIGLFCFFYFTINWLIILPVLFTIAGIFLIFQEYFFTPKEIDDEEVDRESQEVSEEEHDRKKK